MKYVLVSSILFFSLAILSCKNEDESSQQPLDLQGNWVSKDFLEALQISHSPKQAMDEQTLYITELLIDNKTSDSVTVYNGQAGYSTLFAEHRGDTLRLKLNKDPYTDVTFDPTTNTLFFTDKALNRVFRFIKADSSFLDTAYEKPITFPSLVNQATFEGKWTFIEHNKTKTSVEFTRKGEVKGWKDYHSYTVCVNGDCAVNESGDVVVIMNNTKTHAYGFKSKGDTLTLYDLQAGSTKGFYKNGQPVALLIKQK